MKAQSPKKILITFARSFLALELARQLHAAGHKIFIADSMEYHVTRFSNTISKCFHLPSPRFDAEGYIDGLVAIVEKEEIDFLLPIYEETTQLAHAHHRFPAHCQLFCPSFELYEQLHNKWSFHCKLEELGIDALQAALVKTPQDLANLSFTKPFALKACYSRASQTLIKVYPKKTVVDFEVEPHNPWIAQEWLEGKKFCTYSICHAGTIHAHGTYPVNFAIDGNSCLIFKNIEHNAIYQWIENFVRKINYTGQIAFDFIQSADDKLYAIECNPRATSGLLLFTNEARLDRAFFKTNTAPIFPKPNASQQIATGMLLYGWRKSAIQNNNLIKFFKTLFSTKDVVFRSNDMKPFLFEPMVFAAIWKNSRKYQLPISSAFTFDHDWNGEPLKTRCDLP